MGAPRPGLGLDFGGVIVASSRDGDEDTGFVGGSDEDALAMPPLPGSFPSIRALAGRFGADRSWIVSKCGARVEARTRAWLDHRRFWEETGVARDHLVICRRRSEKAVECARLGVTHFVDDRLDVLVAMRDTVANLYLFGGPREGAQVPHWVTRVHGWSDLLRTVQP